MKRLTKAVVAVLAAALCLLPVLSLGAGAIPTLQKGDQLTVAEVETDGSGAVWYRLRLPDGSTAYLPADALTAEISAASATAAPARSPDSTMVWVSGSGKKYHSESTCSNMKSPRQITLEEAVRQGYTPCKKCY